MKYLVEEESLKLIADRLRYEFPSEKFVFPTGIAEGIDRYAEVYENRGYNIGMMDGYDDGYSIGYQMGNSDGYDIGRQEGKTEEYERLVDETKLLPTTIQATEILRVDDVSEIPVGGSLTAYNHITTDFYICGKNLINPQVYFNDSNATTLEDDVFTTTFTNGAVYVNMGYSNKHQTHPKGTYTLTFVPVSSGANINVVVYRANDRSLITSKGLVSTNPTLTFTADEEFFIAIGGVSGKYGTHSYKLQLEVGNVATGYEKYKGYTARIQSSDFTWFSPTTTVYTLVPNRDFTFNYNRSYGQQTAYDAFWDSLQQNGNRTSYACAFGGWTDAIFKPKYDICPTDGYMMFRSTGIQDLRNIGVKLDFSKCTNVQYMFQWATTKYIGEMDLRGLSSNPSNTFAYSQLITIEKLILKDDGTQRLDNAMFSSATALRNITIEGVIGANLSFSSCKYLTRASIESIVNALYVSATGKTLTLNTAAVNKAFETAEGANDGVASTEWADLVATKTNWTINLV